jgi:hypothetical protein
MVYNVMQMPSTNCDMNCTLPLLKFVTVGLNNIELVFLCFRIGDLYEMMIATVPKPCVAGCLMYPIHLLCKLISRNGLVLSFKSCDSCCVFITLPSLAFALF